MICTWLLSFVTQEVSEIFHVSLFLLRDSDVAEKLSRGISAYWPDRPIAALALMSGFAFQRGMAGATGVVAVTCSGVTWPELSGEEMVPCLHRAWARGARLRL